MIISFAIVRWFPLRPSVMHRFCGASLDWGAIIPLAPRRLVTSPNCEETKFVTSSDGLAASVKKLTSHGEVPAAVALIRSYETTAGG